MSIYFHRLAVGYPDKQLIPADTPNCWKVYQICEQQNQVSSLALADVKALGKNDKEKARGCLSELTKKAATGYLFSELYDEKTCHIAFDFKHDHHTYDVHRIRSGDLRVYFIYQPCKVIVILYIAAKRENKISKGDKKFISDRAILVIDQVKNGSFEEFVINDQKLYGSPASV